VLRKKQPAIRLLLTYLDPNLGFTGSVYRSTNWFHFGRETKKPYYYSGSEYITTRELIRRHHTVDPLELLERDGELCRSSLELLPLEVYGYWLSRDR